MNSRPTHADLMVEQPAKVVPGIAWVFFQAGIADRMADAKVTCARQMIILHSCYVFSTYRLSVIPSAKKENQYYALVFLLLEDSFKDF